MCCIFEAATTAAVLQCCISGPKNAILHATIDALGTIVFFGNILHDVPGVLLLLDSTSSTGATRFYGEILLRLHYPGNVLVLNRSWIFLKNYGLWGENSARP